MEQRKVFLNENKGITASNQNTNISVNFESDVRLLPYGDINEKLSLYKLYTDERDNCETYRMIFTINPLCTNVLYNMVTEVVRKEGSNDCVCLAYKNDSPTNNGAIVNSSRITPAQALRDTEYTHKELFRENLMAGSYAKYANEPYVYHCGVDIFNNHFLRKEDFTYVSYLASNEPIGKDVFNTIFDFMRNASGKTIQEKISINESVNTLTNMHIYQYDTILSMADAYRNRLNEENGWYGFTNPGNIEIPNVNVENDWISVNRLMNNNKACEFIDLYPDRSLFSFIPKVNKYRNRLEYNWDYDIVYPYLSDYEMVDTISGMRTTSENKNYIKIVAVEQSYTNSGTELVKFKSMFNTTIKSGDYIRLYYEVDDEEGKRFSSRIKIISCGDSSGLDCNRYFSIKYSDISRYFGFDNEGKLRPRNDNLDIDTDKEVTFYYKKDVNGYECKYYFRKFKKIKDEGLESEINKLAYGENIYGDRMAQIVFTDDINVSGLVDNLGMPLHEVYLMFFKTNRGHEEWYPSNGNGRTNLAKIEFSHCFGKLTSGLDLPVECYDYNVRKLHNINFNASTINDTTREVFSDLSSRDNPKAIENDITKDGMDDFYGDLVEFDVTTFRETVLENVYHRFNTAQRECENFGCFGKIVEDTIVYDDYDYGVNTYADSKFKSGSTILNTTISGTREYSGNLAPEGYFYNPKTRVQFKEFSDNLSESTVKLVKPEKITFSQQGYIGIDGFTLDESEAVIDENGNTVKVWDVQIDTKTKYDWIKKDTIYFYDNKNQSTVFGFVDKFEVSETGTTVHVLVDYGELIPDDMERYSLVTTRDNVPIYAQYLPNSRKFIWRELLKLSELTSDDVLYDMPFSNGCLYIHQNVNFFLKRQDPTNEFGMCFPEKLDTNMKQFKKGGWEKYDRTAIQYIDNNFTNICY